MAAEEEAWAFPLAYLADDICAILFDDLDLSGCPDVFEVVLDPFARGSSLAGGPDVSYDMRVFAVSTAVMSSIGSGWGY